MLGCYNVGDRFCAGSKYDWSWVFRFLVGLFLMRKSDRNLEGGARLKDAQRKDGRLDDMKI